MTQRISLPVLNFYRFYNVALARKIRSEILDAQLSWVKVVRQEESAEHNDLNYSTLNTMTELREWIQTCLDAVTEQELPPKLTCTPTELWLTRTQQGQFMHHHTHPMSVFSGVFYLQDSPGSTEFTMPTWFEERWPQMVCPQTVDQKPSWSSPCKEGHMIVFPSHVFHRQRPLTGGPDRYSVAWNSFWQGQICDRPSTRLWVQSRDQEPS